MSEGYTMTPKGLAAKKVLRYNVNVTLNSTLMSVTRSTVSFTENNWNRITDANNRSKLVNDALTYFFTAQDYLKEKEEEFILGELKHYQDSGEHYTFEETFRD